MYEYIYIYIYIKIDREREIERGISLIDYIIDAYGYLGASWQSGNKSHSLKTMASTHKPNYETIYRVHVATTPLFVCRGLYIPAHTTADISCFSWPSFWPAQASAHHCHL